ncbi:MAG: toprim domain-containing protein [Bacteroidaceae bacterium]|nr:toprim domain-containing protein [Bacteroidaceae bacterium]
MASCGTALTENQIALLKEYVPTVKGMKHVTVMYDSDNAGMAANMRNGKLLMKAGFNVRIVLLPQGEDPDSFCLSHTADEVKEYLKGNSQSLLKLMVEQAIAKSGDDYREELEIIREFLDKIE